jgi:hypothetical protein
MGDVARDFDELVTGPGGPVTFTLAGQPWELPAELPHQAALYLDGLAHDKGDEYELSLGEIERMARMLFDDPTVDEWLRFGVGLTRLSAVVEWSLDQLSSQLDTRTSDEDGEPAPLPEG